MICSFGMEAPSVASAETRRQLLRVPVAADGRGEEGPQRKLDSGGSGDRQRRVPGRRRLGPRLRRRGPGRRTGVDGGAES